MATKEIIKNNPIKIALGSTGSIVAVVAALFAVDARYAHAEDVAKAASYTQHLVLETTQTLRRQSLEDKLFELDFKKAQAPNHQLLPIDEALYLRYMRQLKELSQLSQTQALVPAK